MEQLEFTATENEAGVRIDRCLSDKYEELSRSYLQKLLKDQGVTVNGKIVKANYKLQAGDLVQTTVPDLSEPDILPENIPLDILYEDDDVLVVNKPKGRCASCKRTHQRNPGKCHYVPLPGKSFRNQRSNASRHCPPH